MPNKPVDAHWNTRIYALYANEGLRAAAIARRLENEGPGSPSARTVQRRLDEWPDKPPEERERYRQYFWPESHPALPWEAAPAALEMLASGRYAGRPLLAAVKWFWRVTQAAPGAGYNWREWAALQLAAAEVVGAKASGAEVRAVEAWLIDYASGKQPTTAKPPIIARRASIPAGTAPKDRMAVIEALMGRPLDRQTKEVIEAQLNRKGGTE